MGNGIYPTFAELVQSGKLKEYLTYIEMTLEGSHLNRDRRIHMNSYELSLNIGGGVTWPERMT